MILCFKKIMKKRLGAGNNSTLNVPSFSIIESKDLNMTKMLEKMITHEEYLASIRDIIY